MIEIVCSRCQTTMTLDDAFAGGVCRCRHCGAIQTVPAKPKSVEPHPAPARPVLRAHRQSLGRYWIILAGLMLLLVVVAVYFLRYHGGG